ncbi:hypothetical protein D3C75_933740 [compost metagenome]
MRPEIDGLRIPGRGGEKQRQGEQHKTAHDLHGPQGIEKLRIVAPWALQDVLPQPHVGKQVQDEQDGGGDGDDAEHFRHQQTGHHQVATQANRLRGDQRPEVPCPSRYRFATKAKRWRYVN